MSGRYILDFQSSEVSEPVIYRLIKDFDIKVNILRAEISSDQRGSMLVEMTAPEADIAKAVEYLGKHSVAMIPLTQALAWKEDDCVHCGACTGVCFPGCLSMDRNTWKLLVDRDKCIACGLCVKACPFGLFSLRFGD